MKKIIFIIAAAVLAVSCAKDHNGGTEGRGLEFVVSVESCGDGTRAATNYGPADYFTGNGGLPLDIAVTFNGETKNHTYDETTGGLISPTGSFEFPPSGDPADILVIWPASSDRKALASAERKDQSTITAFMLEDWLVCNMTDVVPTLKIPVFFRHEKSRIAFVLAGAKAGEEISALAISGFNAYCGEAGKGQIIIDTVVDIDDFAAGTSGTMTIGTQNYVFTLDQAIEDMNPGAYKEIVLEVQ